MEIKFLRDEYIDKTKKLRSSLRVYNPVLLRAMFTFCVPRISRVNIIGKFSIEPAAHEIAYPSESLYKIISSID